MSFDKNQYVVEGEAAESDDDDMVEEVGQVRLPSHASTVKMHYNRDTHTLISHCRI